jgi:uncharacterized membrane protein
MASNGLVIQWGINHPDADMNAFISAVDHYRALKRSGAIEDVHIYLHSQGERSERTGTLVVDATREQINTLIFSEEHAQVIAHAESASTNFSMTRVDADANAWIPPARTTATAPVFR